MASIGLDLPLPLGPMMDVNCLNGPMTWWPLYDLKLSHSMREIVPPRTATAVLFSSADLTSSAPSVPNADGCPEGGRKKGRSA